MRKKIALGLAGVMMLASLSGCGTSSSEYLLDVKYSKYVDLCEYKGVEATNVVYEVTDEEIQEEIDMLMYDYATYDPVTDRGLEEGDYATIAYTTTVDGEELEDYTAEEEEILVGEGMLFPELEEALVGMETGEQKTVEVELTAEYVAEDYVGKQASVDVTLNGITVENVPEYNLEFVQEELEYDTLEAYEESVKKDLEESKKEEYKYVAVEDILTYLVDNSKFDGYPEELYAQCEEYYNDSNESYASMFGMTLEEYMEMLGLDEATMKEEIEANVNYELVIGAIAQEENIDCTEEEIREYVNEIYEDYLYESADAFLEDYSLADIGYELIYQKVSDFLYENATLIDMSEEEYLEEMESYYEDDSEESDEDAESEEDVESEEVEEEASEEDSAEKTSEEEASEEDSEEDTTTEE